MTARLVAYSPQVLFVVSFIVHGLLAIALVMVARLRGWK